MWLWSSAAGVLGLVRVWYNAAINAGGISVAAMTAVSKMSEFWRVLRDLSPESVRRDVERGFSLALLGTDEAGKEALRGALQPASGCAQSEYLVQVAGLAEASRHQVPPRADLYLYVVNASSGLSGVDVSALEQLYLLARPTALIFAGDGCGSLAGRLDHVSRDLGGLVSTAVAVDPCDPAGVERHLGALLLATLPNRSLAMARRLAILRPLVAERVIAETARVNAEVALLSNLPANIPVVGTLMGAGADFLVLTKNQLMMVLKLAAIHGRDLRRKWQLAAELAPVVGAALAWRTIARLLVGSLPTPVAALPKAAIAYVGTVVVGQAAGFYFEHGTRPPPELERRFAREAAADWQHAFSTTGN